MKDFLKKLGSRKFILALISIVSGIMTMANCNDSLIQLICGLITVIVPLVIYIVTEGVLDYKGIGLALENMMEIIQNYIDSRISEEKEKEKENEDLLKEGELEISEDGATIIK
jgi:hypothetical protein